MSDTLREPPFVVEQHPFMVMRCAGKNGTVMTLERMIEAWQIYEYSDPLSHSRGWWFLMLARPYDPLMTKSLRAKHQKYKVEEFGQAVCALLDYLESTVAIEPQNWLRADDVFEGHFRTRRAHMEFGERVITEDAPP